MAFGEDFEALLHCFRVLLQVLQKHGRGRALACAHERRIEGHQDERVLLLGLDQFPDSLEERFVKVEPRELKLRPVGRFLQELLARVCLLELDFEEIHVGVAEKLQVARGGRGTSLVIVAEVEEKSSGGVVGGALAGEPPKHAFTFVGWGGSGEGGSDQARGSGETEERTSVHVCRIQGAGGQAGLQLTGSFTLDKVPAAIAQQVQETLEE